MATSDQSAPAAAAVPEPRRAPDEREPAARSRHDGYYWDVEAATWRPCPNASRT